MKKKYVLILEFEAEIKEIVMNGVGKNKMDRFFAAFFKEFLKNDNVIRNIYRLMLMSDLADDNHIFEMDRDIHDLEKKGEFEILKPVFQFLSYDEKAHFLNISRLDNKRRELFFNRFLSHFSKLKIAKSSFMQKGSMLD